ncbi:MAG: family 16 glycosylhydrolase [Rikenellaceae bacterium]
MNKIIFALSALFVAASCGSAAEPALIAMPNSPVDLNPSEWVFSEELSDEFNVEEIDEAKWDPITNKWGPWSWERRHIYTEDGILHVAADYEPHTRGGKQLFYTSGILSSKAEFTYGYMEARVKGCELQNGFCPAFWLRGSVKEAVNGVYYSEIDIIELQQDENMGQIDCNLHTIVDQDGERVWIRPKQRPDLCGNKWMAPWDAREDYHLYGCESTPEYIRWYIDGEMVIEQPNIYWHLPMKVAFSMGLRPPLLRYVGDDRVPIEENSTDEGFPTSMKVDYVRTWVRK